MAKSKKGTVAAPLTNPEPSALPTILVDTREQIPWKMDFDWVASAKRQKLDTGDYAIEGLEHVCVIDRKASMSELAGNLLSSRFARELNRMSTIKLPFIVCEFPYRQLLSYPFNCGMSAFLERKIRVRGGFLAAVLNKMRLDYPYVHWHFADDMPSAKSFAANILRGVSKYADN